MSDQAHDPELTNLESALRGLAPSAGTLTTEMLMYRAGQASTTGRRRPWQAATALLALVTLGLALAWRLQPAPAPVEHTRYVDREVRVLVPAPAPEPQPSAPATAPSARLDEPSSAHASYLEDRDFALSFGIDALPLRESKKARGSPPRGHEPLRAGSSTLFDPYRSLSTKRLGDSL